MKKFLLFALLLFPITAHAQGFMTGLFVGNLLSGKSNSSIAQTGDVMILYSASEEIRKAADPLLVRTVSIMGCTTDQNSDCYVFKSTALGDLFASAMRARSEKSQDVTLLLAYQVISPGHSYTTFHFYYINNSDLKKVGS